MASHWYTPDGAPLYTVPRADGKGERDTNKGDARKLNLVPSVTTIMGIVDKPALTRWKINEVLEAVLGDNVDPYYDQLDYSNEKECLDWKSYILRRSEKKGKNAAEAGSKIHDALEHYYLGEGLSLDMHEFCAPVIELIEKEFGKLEWVPEASFSHPNGFGGKCDLHFKGQSNVDREIITPDGVGIKVPKMGIILDFKTKIAEDFSKVKAYPEQCQQLVAYREGFNLPYADCYNLFIGTNKPGDLLLHRWEEAECQKAWRCFSHLVSYWKEINNFI